MRSRLLAGALLALAATIAHGHEYQAGGLTIGHKAYVISQGGQADPAGRQRLFKNWAYCWRTKRRKEQEQQYLTIDPHSPPEFRANIVRNLDEFHEVFGTTASDGLWLDPTERVRIW